MVKPFPTSRARLTSEQLSSCESNIRNLLNELRQQRCSCETWFSALKQIEVAQAIQLIPIYEKQIKYIQGFRPAVEYLDYIDNPGSRIQLLTSTIQNEFEWYLLAWMEGLDQLVALAGIQAPTNTGSAKDIPTANSRSRCKLEPIFLGEEGVAEKMLKLQEDPRLFSPQFLVSTDASFLGVKGL